MLAVKILIHLICSKCNQKYINSCISVTCMHVFKDTQESLKNVYALGRATEQHLCVQSVRIDELELQIPCWLA